MKTKPLTKDAVVLRLVPNAGPSSAFFRLIREYRTAAELSRMKTAVFEVEFKRLPKRAKVPIVLEREIVEMQDATAAEDRAAAAIMAFIDATF